MLLTDRQTETETFCWMHSKIRMKLSIFIITPKIYFIYCRDKRWQRPFPSTTWLLQCLLVIGGWVMGGGVTQFDRQLFNADCVDSCRYTHVGHPQRHATQQASKHRVKTQFLGGGGGAALGTPAGDQWWRSSLADDDRVPLLTTAGATTCKSIEMGWSKLE